MGRRCRVCQQILLLKEAHKLRVVDEESRSRVHLCGWNVCALHFTAQLLVAEVWTSPPWIWPALPSGLHVEREAFSVCILAKVSSPTFPQSTEWVDLKGCSDSSLSKNIVTDELAAQICCLCGTRPPFLPTHQNNHHSAPRLGFFSVESLKIKRQPVFIVTSIPMFSVFGFTMSPLDWLILKSKLTLPGFPRHDWVIWEQFTMGRHPKQNNTSPPSSTYSLSKQNTLDILFLFWNHLPHRIFNKAYSTYFVWQRLMQ